MLATTITLDDASGDDVVYNQVLSNVPGEVRRVDPSKSFSEPRTLIIRQSVQGKGASLADRRNVTFSETIRGSNGVLSTGSVSISIVQPREGAVTEQMLLDLIANAVDFLSSGALTGLSDTTTARALLRGEA